MVNAACRDLRWARARHANQNGVDWDRVIRQLNKDIIAANDFLPDDKQVCSSTIMSLGCHYLLALSTSHLLSLGCHHSQQELLAARHQEGCETVAIDNDKQTQISNTLIVFAAHNVLTDERQKQQVHLEVTAHVYASAGSLEESAALHEAL